MFGVHLARRTRQILDFRLRRQLRLPGAGSLLTRRGDLDEDRRVTRCSADVAALVVRFHACLFARGTRAEMARMLCPFLVMTIGSFPTSFRIQTLICARC